MICEVLDANMHENGLDHLLDSPNMDLSSPTNYSDDFVDNVLIEESNLVQDVDVEASQIRSYPLMDDAISNCLNNSMNSSDCVSQSQEEPETVIPCTDVKNGNTHECNQQKTSGLQGDDIHYHSVLSNLLKSSHQLILGPYMGRVGRESSFVCWKRDGQSVSRSCSNRASQNLLKKLLFEVPRMHELSRVQSGKKNVNSKPVVDEVDKNHVLSERKRREKINERFTILGSLVPSGAKVDKVSILDHTIEYMRELERRVEELESYKESMELESTIRSKSHDAIERTSGNYGPNKTGNIKKPPSNKRKTREKDQIGAENSKSRLRDSTTDSVNVSVDGKDVLIEVRCSCKENVLVEVMAVIGKLHLETQNVQSSMTDGTLSTTIRAKCKGLKAASAVVIKQALEKVARN
nr:MYC8 [Pogostemon cablin]